MVVAMGQQHQQGGRRGAGPRAAGQPRRLALVSVRVPLSALSRFLPSFIHCN